MQENKKQRYSVETSLRAMKYNLIDHLEGCVIKSVKIKENNHEAGRALFEEAIQLNRKYDDDNLYLDEINSL